MILRTKLKFGSASDFGKRFAFAIGDFAMISDGVIIPALDGERAEDVVDYALELCDQYFWTGSVYRKDIVAYYKCHGDLLHKSSSEGLGDLIMTFQDYKKATGFKKSGFKLTLELEKLKSWKMVIRQSPSCGLFCPDEGSPK